jgi:ATP-dependent Clp protease protease subunit
MEGYGKLDFYGEFKNYAMNHMGVSGMQLRAWEDMQTSIYNNVTVPSGSLTPYILEERPMRATQMDIFSRMMMDRILWVSGPVNDRMSTVVQAQLMFLDDLDVRDITMHVDSPGGSVKSGLSMVDVMNYVASDIVTINTGMAASMGSILLGNGTKGKRFSLKNSKVMLHQVSTGAQGTMADVRISIAEGDKYNEILFDMLGEFSGKSPKEVMKDADRDLWLTSSEALDYGLIDGVILKKKAK